MKTLKILLLMGTMLFAYSNPPTGRIGSTDSVMDGTNETGGQHANFKDEREIQDTKGTIQRDELGIILIAFLIGMVSAFLVIFFLPATQPLRILWTRSMARVARLELQILNYQDREKRLRQVLNENRNGGKLMKVNKFSAILDEPIPRTGTMSFEFNCGRFIMACITTVLMAIIIFDVQNISPNIAHNLFYSGLSIGACSLSAALMEIFRWKFADRPIPNLILSTSLFCLMLGATKISNLMSRRSSTFSNWHAYTEKNIGDRHLVPTVAEVVFIIQQFKLLIMGTFTCNMLAKCAADYKHALLFYSFAFVVCIICFGIIISFTGPLHLSLCAEIVFIFLALIAVFEFED